MDKKWDGKFQVLIKQCGEMKFWEYLTKVFNLKREYPQKSYVGFESSAIIISLGPLQ